jgi:hypothetical protein
MNFLVGADDTCREKILMKQDEDECGFQLALLEENSSYFNVLEKYSS